MLYRKDFCSSLTLLEREGAGPLGGSLGVLLGCGIMGAPSALWEGVTGSFSTKTDPERSEPALTGRPVCKEEGEQNRKERGGEEERKKKWKKKEDGGAIKREKVNIYLCIFLSSL